MLSPLGPLPWVEPRILGCPRSLEIVFLSFPPIPFFNFLQMFWSSHKEDGGDEFFSLLFAHDITSFP